MSVLTAALKELIRLGVEGEALIAAMERLEAAAYDEPRFDLEDVVAVATAREDVKFLSPGAQRQRRYRERKASHGVTKRHCDVTRDASSPETKVSPEPPSKTQTLSPPSPPKGGSSPKISGFDRFWEAYDRKVGKGAARRAYDRAEAKLRAEGRDPLPTILAALDRVRPTWDDPEFIPHPSTWLNGERWDDEPELPPPKGSDPASDYAARHMPARLDVSLDDLKAQLDAELGDAA